MNPDPVIKGLSKSGSLLSVRDSKEFQNKSFDILYYLWFNRYRTYIGVFDNTFFSNKQKREGMAWICGKEGTS